MQVPRAAFEAQRDKEQLLMDRGHEYIRAITLFTHKYNRFPNTMEDLENTNNIRFLRRRYADPMTGKTDWRILHAGPGGTITDSILNSQKPGAGTQQTFITELQMFGTAPTADPEGVNLATRQRPSDQPGAPGDPNSAGADQNPSPGGASLGSFGNSNSGYNGPVMVLPDGRIVPANSSGTAPTTAAPPPPPGTPGAVGVPGVGAPLPTGVAIQQNTQGGQNGQNTPALPSNLGPPASASSLINQILTSPRPGGFNGIGLPGVPQQGTPGGTPGVATPGASGTSSTAGSSSPQQQVIGAGLAGVASKREQEGVKTYNNRTKYNEWEFVYDVTKDPAKVGTAAATANGAAGATGGQGRGGIPGQPLAPPP
jgi:hypothetical protein